MALTYNPKIANKKQPDKMQIVPREAKIKKRKLKCGQQKQG